MSNMLHGKTYSCGCCNSKGRDVTRASERVEVEREIREQTDEEES